MATVVKIPEFVLIEAKQMKNRRVEVAHMVSLADAAETKFVCFANDLSTFDATTGEPHGVTVHVVVAAIAAF